MITYACFGKCYGTSCLGLTLFGSYNRVSLASLRFAQIPRLLLRTSDALKTLYEMPEPAFMKLQKW